MAQCKYGKEKKSMEPKKLIDSEWKLFENAKHIWNLDLIEEPALQTSRHHISGYKQKNRDNNSSMEI